MSKRRWAFSLVAPPLLGLLCLSCGSSSVLRATPNGEWPDFPDRRTRGERRQRHVGARLEQRGLAGHRHGGSFSAAGTSSGGGGGVPIIVVPPRRSSEESFLAPVVDGQVTCSARIQRADG